MIETLFFICFVIP